MMIKCKYQNRKLPGHINTNRRCVYCIKAECETWVVMIMSNDIERFPIDELLENHIKLSLTVLVRNESSIKMLMAVMGFLFTSSILPFPVFPCSSFSNSYRAFILMQFYVIIRFPTVLLVYRIVNSSFHAVFQIVITVFQLFFIFQTLYRTQKSGPHILVSWFSSSIQITFNIYF